ncbi:MAG: exonuclease domain-containing protein [Rhodospirillaceae bacterium]
MAARWLQALIGEDLVRWGLAARHRGTPLGDYYRVDTPTTDTPWDTVPFLAVDLETTGLDPQADAIVSIGWVPVIGGRVVLAEARHHVVRVARPMPEASAVLHGILDDEAAAARGLEQVLPEFLAALKGRVPVAHHAASEREFLDAACRRLYGAPLVVPYVDTLGLEVRQCKRRGDTMGPGQLRLPACRERYGLPRYRAHNALVDAVACAELLLAQVAYMTPQPVRIGAQGAGRVDGRHPIRLEQLLT